MSRITALIAASLLALPAAGLAQRTPTALVTAPANQIMVSYADLDVASAAGKRTLNRRLGGAIEQVCGSFANAREYSDEERVTQCRSAAWASATRQLADRPTNQRLALNILR